MEELIFQIQGSELEPYQVRVVRREDGNVSAYCTCQAASNGMHCKHRIGLLTGKPEGVIGKRKQDAETVALWVRGSDIERILTEIETSETELESLKARIAKLKKLLARAMLD